MSKTDKIAIVAPARAISEEIAERVTNCVDSHFGAAAPDLLFHPQCFQEKGHFAGDDDSRTRAFLDAANDPDIGAVWFARGGYGSNRLDPDFVRKLGPEARSKTYLGYSDAGFLLARLYKEKIGRVAHGPMAADIMRNRGEAAILRAVSFLIGQPGDSLEATPKPAAPCVAFNITVLSHLIGTDAAPDLAGHILMLEEVSEYLYATDRSLGHVLQSGAMKALAGVMLGRVSDILENDPPFEGSAEDSCRYWCERVGIAYLGRADIGHDPDNKIVIFGD